MSRQTLSLFFFIISLFSIVSISMAESAPIQSSSAATVHIVYTEKPQDEEPEACHIRTLASVLGSEEAAKEALIYSYKNAASGFSAKLTPDQVSRISIILSLGRSRSCCCVCNQPYNHNRVCSRWSQAGPSSCTQDMEGSTCENNITV